MLETIFVDAQEMHKQHPLTFDVPNKEQLDSLEKGLFVKVCAEDERFWVEVTKITGEVITGTINNDLVRTNRHFLKDGDTIVFEKRHIYNIIKA